MASGPSSPLEFSASQSYDQQIAILRKMECLKPLIMTFNCAKTMIQPEVLAMYLFREMWSEKDTRKPEIIVLALQEVAPHAFAYIGGVFLQPYLVLFDRMIEAYAQSIDSDYINYMTRNVGTTALIIYIRKDHFHRVRQPAFGGVGVGDDELGNKGAVAIRFGYRSQLNGIVYMTFVAAHLASDENRCVRRNQDWANIVSRAILEPVAEHPLTPPRAAELIPLLENIQPNDEADLYYEFPAETQIYTPNSHLFVAGDLNYRTCDAPPMSTSNGFFPCLGVAREDGRHWNHLLPWDQLTRELEGGKVLHGFIENAINFPPTYKYGQKARAAAKTNDDEILELPEACDNTCLREEVRDAAMEALTSPRSWEPAFVAEPWSSDHWPSWPDRILWVDFPPWAPGQAPIEVVRYTALPLMSTSDHRPVILEVGIPMRMLPPKDKGDFHFQDDVRLKMPYANDPDWKAKRAKARKDEIWIGVTAYFTRTTEGLMAATVTIGALAGVLAWRMGWLEAGGRALRG